MVLLSVLILVSTVDGQLEIPKQRFFLPIFLDNQI
jgi:hypothetical protein